MSSVRKMKVATCSIHESEDSMNKPKTQNNTDMTSSTTSMTSSLSSPVDSGVQLLDSESEATSVMSTSGAGCEMESILVSDNESSAKTEPNNSKRLTVIDLTDSISQTESPGNINDNNIGTTQNEIETNELKCQMDLFEKEFGIASIKEYFMCGKENIENVSTLDLFSENLNYADKLELYAKQNALTGSNSSPCLRKSGLLEFGMHGTLNKSLSDDVFEMEHPIQGKLERTTTEADLMNVSLTSYELLDYTSQNLVLPVINDPMNVSMSEEVNENLVAQLKSSIHQATESNLKDVPVIEPEPKATDEQIVYRRQRKKKSKSDTPKKRVSFHEDILNSTKIDDIHINHGFITHEPDVSFSFFQRGFIRKPDVVKGRYSWAAEGDAPYYEKPVSSRKTNSDMYVQNQKYSSTSSSSTGSISSSIDEEDSSDENVSKKSPSLTQPKSSCLKKTSKKRTIDTKIVHEEINIPRQKSDTNLLDTNIFGSLKNILTFSTSVPLAERGVPEGQEDIPVYSPGNDKSNRRRSCTNFSFLETEGMVIKEEPVKRRGNLNLEVAKSNFRLSRSEGFYPNYPVDQQLPPNIILCDSNVYEHKGISYSYEYDNFQKTFEQQNKPKSSNLYQLIMKEFNFFRKKGKEEPEKEAKEEVDLPTSTPKKDEETGVETSPVETSSKSLLSTYASSSKLDWSDNETPLSEFSETTHSRHLNSPKRKINRSNHYSTQSSFKISTESELNSFLSKNETVSRPSTSKSSLIDRFLRNVTLKKILDAKSAKRHKNDRNYLSLYVKGIKDKFTGYDELDQELEKEIIHGLKKKEANAVVYDKRMITQLKREVFRSQLETFIRLFMVRSAYTPKGDSKPLLAILTNAALYITSLISGGRYRNHFFIPYSDLSTILIGPNGQTIHISNFKQDMQCMITTGCTQVTNDFISQLAMAMRKSLNKSDVPAVKQLTLQDMVNLRKTICKQTAVRKDEEYVYYSIVDIQELSADIEDVTSHGPTKEGPLMFRTKESNPKWETAYFILKAGVLYMLSSASNRVPMMVYPLINGACQGARRITNSPRPHTFQIIVNGKGLQLAAPDEYVASEWLQALIHAANGTHYKDRLITQSCSLLMTTEHILTVREAFPCTVQSLLPDDLEQELLSGPQALSCASILDLVSFRLPSAEQSWCVLEFACREVYECGGDWILYFASNAELESFISTLEVLWEYNNEKVETHPTIHITSDLIHAVSSGEEGRSLFVSVDVPFLKQLTQVYYEHGLLEALHTASSHRQKIISNLAFVALNVFNLYQRTRLFLNPSLQYKGINTINQYSQTRNWASYSVRCIAWHPYSCTIAVCTVDDIVRIYRSDNKTNCLLRCKQQKNVTCLAWRPLTNGELAVGHEGGIIVWSIDSHSLVVRPSMSNAIILYEVNHKPVISLTWSPRGDLLVSAAACDKSIYVWNVELDRNSALKKPGGTGNIIVKWSPTGDKMFSSSNGIVFRVWDCLSWESEKWTVLSGRVQTACWTNCGTHILFATSTEPLIYALRVKSGVVFTSDVESSNDQAIPLFDLTKIENDGVCIGGLVQAMEIDPTGNHLAVLFQNTNLIALFNIARKHNIELIASSLITQCNAIPTTMSFQQNFENGACLSIGWSNGKVQHFPIIYTDLAKELK